MPANISEYVPQCSGTGRRQLAAWGFALACASSLVGMIVAAPLLAAGGHGVAAFVMYKAFGVVCHQMPERSFHLLGHPLAVCARCTGLYAGAAAGVLVYPLVRRVARTDTPARAWLFVAALPTTLDFALGLTGVWENTHLSRFATTALLGIVLAFFIVPGAVDLSRMWNWPGARTRRTARAATTGNLNCT